MGSMSDAVLGWIIILTLIIGTGYIVKKELTLRKKQDLMVLVV